jgi:two-component system LytT family sensor kinase
MTHDTWLGSLLVKLAVMASIASILARSNRFKSILLQEKRTMMQRLELALWLSIFFAASAATRIFNRAYQGADLGLEGSLIAGILGGYVTGLVSGIVISLPAFLFAGGYATMPLLAGIGVLGGLLRDIAPGPEAIWQFTPLFDFYRFF